MAIEQTGSIIGRPATGSDTDTITLSQLPKVTTLAATDLIEKAGGTVVGFSFVMRLDGLDGLDKLDGKPSSSLIAMPA